MTLTWQLILDAWYDVSGFMQQGGWVLWILYATALLLWYLILERIYYFKVLHPASARSLSKQWLSRQDKSSWRAKAVRDMLVSQNNLALSNRLKLISTLVLACPLIGLLGTVSGMVALFELIAISGNSDAKVMSSGIYQAILPTLAGLVVGLSGYYFTERLNQKAEQYGLLLADELAMEGTEGRNA